MSKRKSLPKTIKQASVMDELITGPSSTDQPTAAEQQKTKQEKEAERRRRRARNQVRYDLPPGMKDRLQTIAAELGAPPGHVAAFLIADALTRLDSGKIDLSTYLTSTRSLKYDHGIEIEGWPSD